jgi:hypothetical protein
MKTIVLLVIILVGIGFAVHGSVAVRAGEAARLTVAVECDRLRKTITRAEQRLQAIPDSRAVAAATAEVDAGVRPATSAAKLGAETVIANNPKLMAEYAKHFRERYGDLGHQGIFKMVGLSPEQIERMKDLNVQAEQRRMDLVAAVETHGVDKHGDAYKTLQAQIEEFRRTEEAAILGDLEPAYREYRRTQNVRHLATRLAVAALYSGETVTAAQVEQVTRILAAHSESVQTGPQNDRPSFTVDWNAAKPLLSRVASAAQIANLQSWHEGVFKMDELLARQEQRTRHLKAQFNAALSSK